MRKPAQWGLALASCLLPAVLMAQSDTAASGKTDEETGASTRAWLKEQTDGVNRGETEPYSAESAGKAYRAYADSIGKPATAAPASQLSTIQTN